MEEKIKALEGITYKEWQILKNVIDNRFSEIKNQNTFTVSENTLENLKIRFNNNTSTHSICSECHEAINSINVWTTKIFIYPSHNSSNDIFLTVKNVKKNVAQIKWTICVYKSINREKSFCL